MPFQVLSQHYSTSAIERRIIVRNVTDVVTVLEGMIHASLNIERQRTFWRHSNVVTHKNTLLNSPPVLFSISRWN